MPHATPRHRPINVTDGPSDGEGAPGSNGRLYPAWRAPELHSDLEPARSRRKRRHDVSDGASKTFDAGDSSGSVGGGGVDVRERDSSIVVPERSAWTTGTDVHMASGAELTERIVDSHEGARVRTDQRKAPTYDGLLKNERMHPERQSALPHRRDVQQAPVFKCIVCGRSFSTRNNRQAHYHEVHSKTDHAR